MKTTISFFSITLAAVTHISFPLASSAQQENRQADTSGPYVVLNDQEYFAPRSDGKSGPDGVLPASTRIYIQGEYKGYYLVRRQGQTQPVGWIKNNSVAPAVENRLNSSPGIVEPAQSPNPLDTVPSNPFTDKNRVWRPSVPRSGTRYWSSNAKPQFGLPTSPYPFLQDQPQPDTREILGNDVTRKLDNINKADSQKKFRHLEQSDYDKMDSFFRDDK